MENLRKFKGLFRAINNKGTSGHDEKVGAASRSGLDVKGLNLVLDVLERKLDELGKNAFGTLELSRLKSQH